jgi:protein phosphatase PTC2/3
MTRPENKDPKTWPKCSFFAIYDGHGGSLCADYLKDHLHQIIITQPCFPENPRKALTEGCRIAEEKFCKIAEQMLPKFDKSGSCAIIVLTVETECYIANVGDSRAIMSIDNGMRVYELS